MTYRSNRDGPDDTSAARQPLSVFFIARNEADRIGAAIRAARDLTDDLIVVDSGSTDATVAIAEGLGARVVHRDWEGYGPQKRFAEELCRHDWMLNLDADEIVTPELRAEIRSLFARGEPEEDGYRIGIAEVFPGEERPHRFAYTLHPVRLYRRSRGRYSASPVHDRVDMAEGARIGSLRAILHHFSVRSLADQLAKLDRYSDQQADDLAARGIVIPTWRILFEFQASFWKAYIIRRHFLRGTYGFLTAANYAIARHMRVAKHYERSRGLTRGPLSDATSVDPPQAKP
ncbi:glycosyltransferase family 2 protein [Enterovirga rhinocerotis]|uniref:Glycosyltransferase involved in cell wall biosynthesis n=1 Tax=Enterovirga rhinocerotis TaxID=1339210 RepID=A0A4R7C9P9_9HYPH|nr:glycosyltransferase family 2 protein [Enterovirga rhinocerotis]TDR94085.1 glycosyltransferase involved in cell wall biosynthesis [Enterovirga rhinocerotis]